MKDFDIIDWESVSKEQLIEEMSQLVAEWIEHRPEEFFSKLYRLDILEKDIKVALQSQDPVKDIAVLIITRQYQKYLSRKAHPHPPLSHEDQDLAW